ncbi:MAG TPA: GNAT family N-acetyltransferase [Tepidisphaeraceae bacterium]
MNIRCTRTLSESQQQRLFGWGKDIFGIETLGLQWRRKDWHVLLEIDGFLVSHAGIVKKQSLSVGDEQLMVCGIGGVVTIPEARNHGYARQVLQSAITFIAEDAESEFAMLFCREALIDFYSQENWMELPTPVFIQQTNSIPSPLAVMIKCVRPRKWPVGPVRVNGLPW